MANRIFLVEASSPETFHCDNESPAILAAASNGVPIYWYSLFDTHCVRSNTMAMEDGRAFTYCSLVTSITDARVRCSRRRSILERLTPPGCEPILKAWMEFLDAVQLPYIHADTAEFCMMADDHDQHLVNCLAAFDSPPALGESFGSIRAWSEMLDVAQIDPDNLAGSVAGFKLAGYRWNRPILWDEKMRPNGQK